MVEEGVRSAEDIDKGRSATASVSATRCWACGSSSTGARDIPITPAVTIKAHLQATVYRAPDG